MRCKGAEVGGCTQGGYRVYLAGTTTGILRRYYPGNLLQDTAGYSLLRALLVLPNTGTAGYLDPWIQACPGTWTHGFRHARVPDQQKS